MGLSIAVNSARWADSKVRTQVTLLQLIQQLPRKHMNFAIHLTKKSTRNVRAYLIGQHSTLSDVDVLQLTLNTFWGLSPPSANTTLEKRGSVFDNAAVSLNTV